MDLSNPLLPFLGLLGAAVAGHSAYSSAGSRSKPKSGRQGRKTQSTGAHGMNPTSGADLAIKLPSNLNVPRRVPRNPTNMVAWDTVKTVNTWTATTTGAPQEIAYTVALNNHPQYTSWQTLYDQYCIPQFSVTFESQLPPGSTSLPITLYTAIDYDSVNALGSIQAIEDFATCREQVMSHGATVVRSVKPAVKSVVSGAGGSRTAALERSWVDCAFPDVLHYGVRGLLSQEAALQVKTTLTIWFAFRNQI